MEGTRFETILTICVVKIRLWLACYDGSIWRVYGKFLERHFDPVCIGMHACCEKALCGGFKEHHNLFRQSFLFYSMQVSSLVTAHFCWLFLRFFSENRGWTLPTLFSILRDLRDLASTIGFSNHLHTQIPSNEILFHCRSITMRNTMVRRVMNAWTNRLESLPKHLEIVWPTGAPHSNTPCIS